MSTFPVNIDNQIKYHQKEIYSNPIKCSPNKKLLYKRFVVNVAVTLHDFSKIILTISVVLGLFVVSI